MIYKPVYFYNAVTTLSSPRSSELSWKTWTQSSTSSAGRSRRLLTPVIRWTKLILLNSTESIHQKELHYPSLLVQLPPQHRPRVPTQHSYIISVTARERGISASLVSIVTAHLHKKILIMCDMVKFCRVRYVYVIFKKGVSGVSA